MMTETCFEEGSDTFWRFDLREGREVACSMISDVGDLEL
jgi:hypothetical protein